MSRPFNPVPSRKVNLGVGGSVASGSGVGVTVPPASRQVNLGVGDSGSNVLSEPFQHLIQHIKQYDPMLFEALARVQGSMTKMSTQITNNTPVAQGIVVDKATFGIGIGGYQPIANDITAHYMVRFPTFVGCQLLEAVSNCKLPAPSAVLPLIIDILKSSDQAVTWNSIFPAGGQITIPPNSVAEVIVTSFAAKPYNMVSPGDMLAISLLSGSNQLSSEIETVLRWGIPI